MRPTDYPINIPVVSAIIERMNEWKKEILIQTRWKPWVSEYSGTLEIPAGWVDKYENIYEALKREVEEETGSKIIKITPDNKTDIVWFHNDWAYAFEPYCCQQQVKGGLQWVWFVFLCEVENTPLKAQKGETKDPKWVEYNELKEMVEKTPEKFFTLQLPVLQFYFNKQKK